MQRHALGTFLTDARKNAKLIDQLVKFGSKQLDILFLVKFTMKSHGLTLKMGSNDANNNPKTACLTAKFTLKIVLNRT